jgi:hypothetical protein
MAAGLTAVGAVAGTAVQLNRRQVMPRLKNRFVRLKGPNYYSWLDHLHATMAPETYVEIGIFDGRSLALARPPTRAIGIDPSPSAVATLRTETHIFPETSDDFFANHRLGDLLGDRPVTLSFIDGLHVFQQALRDFINLEAHSGPRSVILFHDVLPLDEASQDAERHTTFWTGDIWKVLLCLKHYRPDLDVFSIATFPSGLGVVSGLDPSSRVLADVYDEAVERYAHWPFSEIEGRMEQALGLVPNDWSLVAERLRSRGVVLNDGTNARTPVAAG